MLLFDELRFLWNCDEILSESLKYQLACKSRLQFKSMVISTTYSEERVSERACVRASKRVSERPSEQVSERAIE